MSNFLQRVLVTGATSGIGKALAKELFSSGCTLILAGRDTNKLAKLKDGLSNNSLSSEVSMH